MSMKETLHYTINSPQNMVKLLCTVLFEKSEWCNEWATLWHETFDSAVGDKLFESFMTELYPEGTTITEAELKNIMLHAFKYLQSDEECLEQKAHQDKQRCASYVYFKPFHKVYKCRFGEHEDMVTKALRDFFGKDIQTIEDKELEKFIKNSFEICNTSINKILNDLDFIKQNAYIDAVYLEKEREECSTTQ